MRVLVKEFNETLGEAAIQSNLDHLLDECKKKKLVVLDLDLKHTGKKYTCVLRYESAFHRASAQTIAARRAF